ncbi:MAG: Fe-S-containing hydro-lyase [Eubacteriales bacterium]
MKTRIIDLPLKEKDLTSLRAGDLVLLNGYVYTARDAAHQRLIEEYDSKGTFPIQLENEMIYYVGPCPNKPGEIIGSAGPTTSGRMDTYTPFLLDNGLKGMMGKGNRSKSVIESIMKNKAIYFGVIGGIGALLKDCIRSATVLAYEDLGTEAIRCLMIKEFPCIVAIDTLGNNIYDIEPKKYRCRRDYNVS